MDYETYYCRTKTEAQKRERELKCKYEITKGPVNQLDNCGELIDKWLQFVKGNGIEDTTYKSYGNHAKMAKKIISDLQPYTLTENNIRERLLQMNSYYTNAQTIKNIYVTIRRILKWGSNSKRQYCPKDLMEEIKNPKAPKIDRDLVKKVCIYDLIKSHKLKVIKFSERHTRIPKSALEEFIKQELEQPLCYNNAVQPPRRGRKPKYGTN